MFDYEGIWIGFGCHASRALHIEMMIDRTTKSFIQAIERMSNRRSLPEELHSDNGKEIIKGEQHIAQLFSTLNTAETHEELKKRGIKWYHNPERSPSKGGHIERLIGVAKKPLLKALINNKYTESELNTLLTSVEAASNLRPLSPISQSPDDHNMLCITPSHLMIGQSLRPLPSDLASYKTGNRKMKMSAV